MGSLDRPVLFAALIGNRWRVLSDDDYQPARDSDWPYPIDDGGYDEDAAAVADRRAERLNVRRGISREQQDEARDIYLAAAAAAKRAACAHSPDFRSVYWFGTQYSFTRKQAPAVKRLWEAWEQGTLDVGDDVLLAADDCESPPANLRTLFRDHPAWQAMIVPGGSKGSHRLAKS